MGKVCVCVWGGVLVCFHPSTGTFVGMGNDERSLAVYLRALHVRLFAGTIGRNFVGLFGLTLLINALTGLDGLHVASRTSAFKARDFDIADIGARLNVGAVLEGSVRKAGNRLRVTAQLIKVSDGYHVWSDRFERELDDVFAIQDDIVVPPHHRPRLHRWAR